MSKYPKAKARLRRWRDDPVLFVRECFGPTHLKDTGHPLVIDEWQVDALISFRDNDRTALSACKGPGKSCVLAWAIWWFLTTHKDAKGICTSITADNLKDNLWTELAKWRARSPIIERAFDQTSERISSVDRPKTWWCSARSFPQQADKTQQANTLAGLHGEYVFVVMDEIGDYPDGVVTAAEGILANDVVARILGAGNPTKVDGPLYRLTTKDRKRWTVIHITGDPQDPKRSPRISLAWANQMIEDWGRDNPWVMVNVLGLFPPLASDRLIGINHVTMAQERNARPLEYSSDAKIWGLDPARYGDDAAALCRRQGVVCFKFHIWRGLDGVELATRVANMIMEARAADVGPDALFVDVGGVGASAYDHLRMLGYVGLIHPIDFGSSPDDSRFLNKRAEIWWRMADWLKKAPANLPTDPELVGELTGPAFKYAARGKQTKFLLESKEEMRKRGIPSPNKADALAMTFSAPVAPKSKEFQIAQLEGVQRCVIDYDPHTSTTMGRREWRDPLHAE